jgi:hypothetical protein
LLNNGDRALPLEIESKGCGRAFTRHEIDTVVPLVGTSARPRRARGVRSTREERVKLELRAARTFEGTLRFEGAGRA